MQTALSAENGYLLLASYGVVMTALVWFGTCRDSTAEQHLVANRNVGLWRGAFSIAVTWIWAPAIFVCSQKSFEQGVAGLFWFTLPNIICFCTFVPFALRARRAMPNSYSLPDFMAQRFAGERGPHLAFLLIVLGTTLTGIISNSLAGGLVLQQLAGTDLRVTILAFAGIALFYSLWRGLQASILTDVIQMGLILLIALVLAPWTLFKAGGVSVLVDGLAGTSGSRNAFDPWIAYSFGIPATIGLISGPISDQMFYQRAMASRKESLGKMFVLGGCIFGIVPIVLSVFGFLAASPNVLPLVVGIDPQMVSVHMVQQFLPTWTLFGFAVMALCGLSSTLDSAYCAAGSLFSVDVYRRYFNSQATDAQLIRAGRLGMLALAVVGTSIALIPGVQLLWIFLIYGTLAAAGLFPALLAVFNPQISGRAVTAGVAVSLCVGLPISIYANVYQSPHLLVFASLGTCLLGLVATWGFGRRQRSVEMAPQLHAKASA